MKKVEEMNLNECLEALRSKAFLYFDNVNVGEIADRIEELTNHLTQRTSPHTFKDEWGNTDWRDKGEMGG